MINRNLKFPRQKALDITQFEWSSGHPTEPWFADHWARAFHNKLIIVKT